MSLKKSVVLAGLAVAALVLPATVARWDLSVLLADSLSCDLSQYKPVQGLTAAVEQEALLVSWTGQNGADLRARYAIDGGQPVVRELAIKKAGGQWTTLGKNLSPEYHVVSGVRRMADDQANPLKAAGIELTEESLRALGVYPANAGQAPWPLIRVFAPGPALTRKDALTQHDTLTPVVGAEALPTQGAAAPAGGS